MFTACLACVASASVGSGEKNYRVKKRLSLQFPAGKIPFRGLSLLPNPTETLATQATAYQLSGTLSFQATSHIWIKSYHRSPLHSNCSTKLLILLEVERLLAGCPFQGLTFTMFGSPYSGYFLRRIERYYQMKGFRDKLNCRCWFIMNLFLSIFRWRISSLYTVVIFKKKRDSCLLSRGRWEIRLTMVTFDGHVLRIISVLQPFCCQIIWHACIRKKNKRTNCLRLVFPRDH